MKTNLYALGTALVLLGGSCKKDDNPVGPDACALASQRAEAISGVANAYATNPSQANCEAYRKAANDFLDAAARCPTVSQADIASARQSVNTLNCQ